MYSLAKRQAEVEILPLALSEQIGVISYSPLGGGLLTGKWVGKGQLVAGTTARLTTNQMYQKRYGDAHYWQVADEFAAYAKAHGTDPATLAVAWVMRHPAVTAPIIGARNAQQLQASLQAADYQMSQDQYKEISALSPEPPPPTDRTEERG
jgi:aryl-alcohol dehydrogenase-like predicted oxidoreductase